MLRRAMVVLLAGLAVIAIGLLALGAVPVLADEPGEEPSPSPSSDPSLTPSPISPTADPSPTPSDIPTTVPNLGGRSTSQSPLGEPPARVRELSAVIGGVIGARPRQAGQTLAVAALDDVFRPTPVTVTVGTTVVWTNQGQNPHTVTANDRAFDSGTFESGQTFSVTFDQVGQVPYYCQIHGTPGSGMTGVVIVQAAPQEEGVSPSPGSEGLPATGVDPIPLAIVALALAITGLAALLAARRATDGRR